MQPIQDKDFDKLFKNAFEDAEITPSRDLWSSIESEIEPKKKRVIPIYWLSAAAVLLIATVGVLVYQQQEAKPNKFANRVEPKVVKPILETQPIKDTTKTLVVPTEKIILPATSKPVEAIAKTSVKETAKPLEKQTVVTAPEMLKQETFIAKVEEPKQEIIKKKIDEAILQANPETVIASTATTVKADDVSGDDNQVENKGIRNVGDVVNLIVNKVDKRKDKFIQFRTDDDDSSLSSINIGPFKFGKKNRK
ncbi:hypothetical protein EZ449_10825 [Pedobacter frigidisoli]|uniref:Uncharacterized protein n=1 Tax=Pedobacter frigidisoli TaxID=2530455 RepID=A0A4R0P0R9_9SPHI|nr:hypothetical protein [Pedobacter frigidisoli]TCD10305.1 hypothetical protein EZ449_10825 [Pedobacter frigidisoli]